MFSLEFEVVEAVVAHDDTRYVLAVDFVSIDRACCNNKKKHEQGYAVSVGKKCLQYLTAISVEPLDLEVSSILFN